MFVPVKDIVVAHGEVEEMAWGDARRVVIVVLGASRWDAYILRACAQITCALLIATG